MRNYDALVSAVIAAIPLREEIAALTDEQLEDLRKVGNTFDNQLYLALTKRHESKGVGRRGRLT